MTGVDPQAGLAALRAQIVPAITRLPGFRSGKWLTGNESGQMSATVARCEIREVAATA